MKKYSKLTPEEFMTTPIKDLVRMEREEFPERCDALARHFAAKILGMIKETTNEMG